MQETLKSSYGALKELLSTGKTEKKWKAFLTKGEMIKVYKKKGGSVHWVRKLDVELLLGSGLYLADTRHGKVVTEGETKKEVEVSQSKTTGEEERHKLIYKKDVS